MKLIKKYFGIKPKINAADRFLKGEMGELIENKDEKFLVCLKCLIVMDRDNYIRTKSRFEKAVKTVIKDK